LGQAATIEVVEEREGVQKQAACLFRSEALRLVLPFFPCLSSYAPTLSVREVKE